MSSIPEPLELLRQAEEDNRAAPGSVEIEKVEILPKEHPDRRDFGYIAWARIGYSYDPKIMTQADRQEYVIELLADPTFESGRAGVSREEFAEMMADEKEGTADPWNRSGQHARADYFFHPDSGWSLGAN